jgi:hypothetical protein
LKTLPTDTHGLTLSTDTTDNAPLELFGAMGASATKADFSHFAVSLCAGVNRDAFVLKHFKSNQ